MAIFKVKSGSKSEKNQALHHKTFDGAITK